MVDGHIDYVSPGLDLLEFPCRYEIKAMGRRDANFETRFHDIVGRHLGGVPIVHTVSRETSGGH